MAAIGNELVSAHSHTRTHTHTKEKPLSFRGEIVHYLKVCRQHSCDLSVWRVCLVVTWCVLSFPPFNPVLLLKISSRPWEASRSFDTLTPATHDGISCRCASMSSPGMSHWDGVSWWMSCYSSQTNTQNPLNPSKWRIRMHTIWGILGKWSCCSVTRPHDY